MCGIAGLLTLDRPVDAELVRAILRMLDAQRHRGPNDWGIVVPSAALDDPEIRSILAADGHGRVRTYPGAVRAPAVILGARRLSILDLSTTASIPMGSRDGRVWITYNGEIYNFEELRAELRGLGHEFRTAGDTEVVLRGYEEWGANVVGRLRGMFAFTVLDARSGGRPRLFLARDRFGIKPLYWARHRSAFVFASEVRALMAGGLVPNDPEPRGFHGFLVYGAVPTPWTTVRGVLSLPAGHELHVDEARYSHPRPRRYWSLPSAGSLSVPRTEAVAEIRRRLDEAVRLHLASDVPLGVFLSGGMDSSAIVALASRHVRHALTTLSVTFDESEFSEADHAADVARRYGTKHIEVRLEARQFLDELPAIFAAMDQPSTDGINTYFVARAAREAGLTVVLSGVGGDEVFWGYPAFRWAPRLARLAKIPGAARVATSFARIARRLGRPRLEKLEFLSDRQATLGSYLTARGLFPPASAARLLGSGRLPLAGLETPLDTLTPALYGRLEVANYLQNQLLRDTDVFGMGHSIEVRVPFLDHRLAEFVFALPPEHFVDGRSNKSLLLDAMGTDYPPGIGARPKMGFTFPFEYWMHEALPDVGGRIRQTKALDVPAAEVVLEHFSKGKVHWSRFWALAVLATMANEGRLPVWNCHPDPPRICFLLPQVYGSKGGIPVYNQQLLRAASEASPASQLDVLSLNDHEIPDAAQVFGRVQFVGAGPRTRRFHRSRALVNAIRMARRSRPHLIVCGHINLAPLGFLLKTMTGSRVALVGHGIEVWNPPARLRWFARHLDRVLPVSRFTADRMVAWGVARERMTLLPDTVDGEVFRPVGDGSPGDRRRVLTVTRLASSEPYKGVDRVLEALATLRSSAPRVSYRVAGTGDDLPRLQRLVTERGLDDVVEFLGFVDDERLPALYGDSDLFIMPSTSEGFGIVFLESLACGTPVVGGNRDGSVDALGGGRLGRLVDPRDVDEIAAAILESMEPVEDRAIRRRRLRDQVLEEYGFDRFRQRVGEVVTQELSA